MIEPNLPIHPDVAAELKRFPIISGPMRGPQTKPGTNAVSFGFVDTDAPKMYGAMRDYVSGGADGKKGSPLLRSAFLRIEDGVLDNHGVLQRTQFEKTDGATIYRPSNNVVHVNPNMGTMTADGKGNSAATLAAHEVIHRLNHAEDPVGTALRHATVVPRYDNAEERLAIQITNIGARDLKEGVADSHRSLPIATRNVSDHAASQIPESQILKARAASHRSAKYAPVITQEFSLSEINRLRNIVGPFHSLRPKLNLQLKRAVTGRENLQAYNALTGKIEAAWQKATPATRAKLATGSMDYEALVPELARLKADYTPSTITQADVTQAPVWQQALTVLTDRMGKVLNA